MREEEGEKGRIRGQEGRRKGGRERLSESLLRMGLYGGKLSKNIH